MDHDQHFRNKNFDTFDPPKRCNLRARVSKQRKVNQNITFLAPRDGMRFDFQHKNRQEMWMKIVS